jgi:hypothetical protein
MMDELCISDRYLGLKGKVKQMGKGFNAFLLMLEKTTHWATAPSGIKSAFSMERELLIHSITVAEYLLTLRSFMAPDIPEESCVIVGLFHEVGKLGMPWKPLYVKEQNRGGNEDTKISYKLNPKLPYMSTAERSLYLVSKYIDLTDAEAQSILYHEGQHVDKNKEIRFKEEPLTLLLHWADYWATHIVESGKSLFFDKSCYGIMSEKSFYGP